MRIEDDRVIGGMQSAGLVGRDMAARTVPTAEGQAAPALATGSPAG